MNKFIKLARCLSNKNYAVALIRHGVAAGVEHQSVLRGLDCSTVVDVGANRGQFALVARHCFPDACIFSFEPLPEPATRFRAMFSNDKRISLQEAAIAPEPGQAIIHIAGRDDSSSLLPITPAQVKLFPGTDEFRTSMVRVGPLSEFVSDDHVKARALLKLDVQGFELEALRGCESLLTKFSYVYAECSFIELYTGQALADEVVAWLRQRRFRLTGTYNIFHDRDGRPVQGDFLFEPYAAPANR